MSVFKPLIINKINIKDDVLVLTDHDVIHYIFDENDLPLNISKIILKASKDIDFVVKLRQNSSLITYEVAPFTRGKIMFMCSDEDIAIAREIHLRESATLTLIMPDFHNGNRKVNIETKLLERKAHAKWHLATYSQSKDKKVFNISFSHFANESFADMYNYGVVLNESTLIFTGESTIFEHVKGAETHQTARIIVFDDNSHAEANPILNIYHNDVIAASHAATVGQVNAEHLYYLKSRGLTEKDAKQLITKGYLMPILNYIDDKAIKENCILALERVI
ncbi:MAG: FeS cluster assembly protein SufD [Tenericutes bacterium ADurb.Bin024]|nr:MAG: FeS cluster assembly protein SufD [Tenericutes bacterium ADurb.Bin024]